MDQSSSAVSSSLALSNNINSKMKELVLAKKGIDLDNSSSDISSIVSLTNSISKSVKSMVTLVPTKFATGSYLTIALGSQNIAATYLSTNNNAVSFGMTFLPNEIILEPSLISNFI